MAISCQGSCLGINVMVVAQEPSFLVLSVMSSQQELTTDHPSTPSLRKKTKLLVLSLLLMDFPFYASHLSRSSRRNCRDSPNDGTSCLHWKLLCLKRPCKCYVLICLSVEWPPFLRGVRGFDVVAGRFWGLGMALYYSSCSHSLPLPFSTIPLTQNIFTIFPSGKLVGFCQSPT